MNGPALLKEMIDSMGVDQFTRARNFIEFSFGMTIEAMTENYGKPMTCRICRKKFHIEDAWDPQEAFIHLSCEKCGLERAQKMAGVPELFRGAKLNLYWTNHADYFDLFLTQSLFIHGQTGTGKTHLASAIVNSLLKTDRVKTVFIEFHDFMRSMRSANRPPKYIPEEVIIRRYAQAPLLLLDDLFGSDENDCPTVYENQKLYELIRDRNNFKLRTIVTCNYGFEQLEKKGWNARITSRLAQLCKTIHLEGDDRRLQLG